MYSCLQCDKMFDGLLALRQHKDDCGGAVICLCCNQNLSRIPVDDAIFDLVKHQEEAKKHLPIEKEVVMEKPIIMVETKNKPLRKTKKMKKITHTPKYKEPEIAEVISGGDPDDWVPENGIPISWFKEKKKYYHTEECTKYFPWCDPKNVKKYGKDIIEKAIKFDDTSNEKEIKPTKKYVREIKIKK